MLISIFFIAIMLVMAVIAIGSSLIGGILNLLFGRRSPRQPFGHTGQSQQTHQSHQSHQSSSQSRATSSGGKRREKIFDKHEGEYVDFEEIKE